MGDNKGESGQFNDNSLDATSNNSSKSHNNSNVVLRNMSWCDYINVSASERQTNYNNCGVRTSILTTIHLILLLLVSSS